MMSQLPAILVAIKPVPDPGARIRAKADGSGVSLDGIKVVINPFDEIAVEEALRLRERGFAGEVVVATIGPPECVSVLRSALALGADRAVLLQTDIQAQPLTAADALHKLALRERPALVMMGKQAIDSDNAQTAQMLAALWGRPQATFASRVEIDGMWATVAREVDAGIETLAVELPAVISTDLRLNEPRYVKLPDIMKAKKKPLEVLTFAELGCVPRQLLRTIRTDAPPARPKGVRVSSCTELVAMLVAKGLL